MRFGWHFARWPRRVARQLLPALRYLNLMRALELRLLAPWVRDIAEKDVLDVGCGHGLYTLDLVQRGANLVGCDVDGPALRAAERNARSLGLHPRSLFLAADAAALPLRQGCFDLVICNCVLEHVSADRAALAAMARCLRPGGILYLSVDHADYGLALGFVERLPAAVRSWLLRHEVASATTISAGLDQRLDRIYAVRRRYHAEALTETLASQGLTVLQRRPYLTGVGAAHFEAFHMLRGVDPGQGVGRILYMLSSLLLYPLSAWSDNRARVQGRGLLLVARNGEEGGA